jgi:dienelactone hydrolase
VPANGSTETAVLILSDAMGHRFNNSQLLADNFAANGLFAVMPDIFRGDPVPFPRPENFDVLSWLKNHLPEHIEPIIKTVISHMKRAGGCKKIAGAGYCIGAKYVLRFRK